MAPKQKRSNNHNNRHHHQEQRSGSTSPDADRALQQPQCVTPPSLPHDVSIVSEPASSLHSYLESSSSLRFSLTHGAESTQHCDAAVTTINQPFPPLSTFSLLGARFPNPAVVDEQDWCASRVLYNMSRDVHMCLDDDEDDDGDDANAAQPPTKIVEHRRSPCQLDDSSELTANSLPDEKPASSVSAVKTKRGTVDKESPTPSKRRRKSATQQETATTKKTIKVASEKEDKSPEEAVTQPQTVKKKAKQKDKDSSGPGSKRNRKGSTPKRTLTMASGKKRALASQEQRGGGNNDSSMEFRNRPSNEDKEGAEDTPDFLRDVDPYQVQDPQIPSTMKGRDEPPLLSFDELNPSDVLMGRGNAVANYPGNQRYRQIIKHYKPAYVNSYRFEKRLVAQQVVTLVTQLGGRFLEQVPGKKGAKESLYRHVKIERALEKIAQACREK